MSKKVYIPSDDQLHQMQELGGNTYLYLLTKVLETLCMEGTKYPCKGILKNAYKYLREEPYLSKAICKMYPEEIVYSKSAQNDISLCLYLLENGQQENGKISNLENLSFFENGIGVLTNKQVIEKTIDILSIHLSKNPKYRFTYKENKLIDDIFSTQIINRIYLGSPSLSGVQQQLATIEPTYILLYNNYEYGNPKNKHMDASIYTYAANYGFELTPDFSDYTKNISLETRESKRLIRCIKQNSK